MTVVDTLQQEYSSIVDFLSTESQPSLASDVNKHFKKVLVLSSASYFEHEIQNILTAFVANCSNDNIMVISLLKQKAISQQYHTYFNWGTKNEPEKPGKNANTFFSLFGDDFKKEMETLIKSDPKLDESVKAFIEIGHLRNILVHSNFASYNLDNKTTDEIYLLYDKGLRFIEFIKDRLK
jgi:hypothetical protein